MCGVVGILRTKNPVEDNDLFLMTDAIAHRGPDGEGFYKWNNFGLAHRRLSIIDIAGGKQPLCNEKGDIWITFNGEIYNFLELKKELVAKGHFFNTNSDTEVIVHAYEEWGTDCVVHLRGMFAFGILDQRKEEFFLARDHFGIKPLVYLQSAGLFAFASEIQALRKMKNADWSLNFSAVDQYLQFQYIPNPETVFQSVKKLPPAHFMRIGKGGEIKELKRYWHLDFRPDNTKTEREWLEELDVVIRDSVKAHLISDVPFGAFLSGGIDSSTIVGYMAQLMNQPVKTFSIGFEEKEFDETSFARQVSQKWHTNHYEEIVKPDALGILPTLVKHYGEPFGDSSAIPAYYVSKLARQHVTMVLTGDAGDELFAGYESYTTRWNKHYSPIPEHLKPAKKIAYFILNKLIPSRYPLRTNKLSDWLQYLYFTNASTRSSLWKKELSQTIAVPNHPAYAHHFSETSNYSHFQKAQYTDFNTYLPGDVLTKVDTASMIHSLETRTPLLDIKVVEFAATIPESFNIKRVNERWEGKLLLKKLSERYYSRDFVYRRKMGFAIPINHWLFHRDRGLQRQVEERLLSSGNGLDRLFNHDVLKKILASNHSGNIWNLLFLEEWLRQNKA